MSRARLTLLLVNAALLAASLAKFSVAGKTFSDAQAQLTKLGFTVKENPSFDQQKADGLVTGQNPPAGTGNTAEVTLDVVRRPVVSRSTLRFLDADSLSRFLDEAGLRVVEQYGDWGRGPCTPAGPEIVTVARAAG